tara:strand:- start:70 stop:405 length:336 start_codon:yes stop_codon:yes gene_type:complete
MYRIIVAALAILTFTPTYAQESDILILTLAHDCGPAERVLPFLREKYGEEPFALGRAGVTLAPGGEAIEGTLLMNVNPKSLTYTINILFPKDKMVCMLVAGDKFRPANRSK